MEPDDLLCSRNAPEFVCLVGWSFWSVWFFWMNFWSDQPDKRDRPDRPDEPAFVGRAQWKINQPPSLERERASLEGACISFDARSRGHPWPLPWRQAVELGSPQWAQLKSP